MLGPQAAASLFHSLAWAACTVTFSPYWYSACHRPRNKEPPPTSGANNHNKPLFKLLLSGILLQNILLLVQHTLLTVVCFWNSVSLHRLDYTETQYVDEAGLELSVLWVPPSVLGLKMCATLLTDTFYTQLQLFLKFFSTLFKDRDSYSPGLPQTPYMGEDGHEFSLHMWICGMCMHVCMYVDMCM